MMKYCNAYNNVVFLKLEKTASYKYRNGITVGAPSEPIIRKSQDETNRLKRMEESRTQLRFEY